MIQKENEKVFKLAVTGLMAALCYVAFTYVKIPIPTIGGDMVALHVGNAFCVLAALLLGGTYGGVAGALGMTIADLMDPAYAGYIFRWSLIASAVSLGFNVIADPVFGYFYKNYVLGVESSAAKIMSTLAAGVTFINAVAGTVVVVAVYSAIRPILKRTGLFFHIR